MTCEWKIFVISAVEPDHAPVSGNYPWRSDFSRTMGGFRLCEVTGPVQSLMNGGFQQLHAGDALFVD